MKKLLFVAVLFIGSQSFAQWPLEKIDGNGQLKREKREMGSFSGLASSGSWNVVIAYGESGTIQVEADENLLQYIDTKVENGRLSIKPTKNVNLRSKNKITVYVSLTRLSEIALSGSGNIVGEGNFTNEGTTHFKLSGSGNIKIGFDKVKEVEAGISGSGNIRLSGTANSLTASISGSGNVDSPELVCEALKARISGSGDVKATANKSVEASISGSGNVFYKGSANDIQRHTAGSGKVVKM